MKVYEKIIIKYFALFAKKYFGNVSLSRFTETIPDFEVYYCKN